MPRKETIAEMAKSIDKGKRQIAKWDQKIMAQEQLLKADVNLAAMYSRKERTHRLCKRGAMLEKFLQSPDLLTDDQVMALLRIAFGQKQAQDALLAELNSVKTVQATPEQKPDRRNYTPRRHELHSLVLTQASGLAHSAAPPLPTK